MSNKHDSAVSSRFVWTGFVLAIGAGVGIIISLLASFDLALGAAIGAGGGLVVGSILERITRG